MLCLLLAHLEKLRGCTASAQALLHVSSLPASPQLCNLKHTPLPAILVIWCLLASVARQHTLHCLAAAPVSLRSWTPPCLATGSSSPCWAWPQISPGEVSLYGPSRPLPCRRQPLEQDSWSPYLIIESNQVNGFPAGQGRAAAPHRPASIETLLMTANPLSSSASFLLAQFLGRQTFSLPFLVNGMHRHSAGKDEAAAPYFALPAVCQKFPCRPQLTCRQ